MTVGFIVKVIVEMKVEKDFSEAEDAWIEWKRFGLLREDVLNVRCECDELMLILWRWQPSICSQEA